VLRSSLLLLLVLLLALLLLLGMLLRFLLMLGTLLRLLLLLPHMRLLFTAGFFVRTLCTCGCLLLGLEGRKTFILRSLLLLLLPLSPLSCIRVHEARDLRHHWAEPWGPRHRWSFVGS
jgi:hypothetical protein